MTEQELKHIETEITTSLENCACLGRDAYGDYIKKLTKSLMATIEKHGLTRKN